MVEKRNQFISHYIFLLLTLPFIWIFCLLMASTIFNLFANFLIDLLSIWIIIIFFFSNETLAWKKTIFQKTGISFFFFFIKYLKTGSKFMRKALTTIVQLTTARERWTILLHHVFLPHLLEKTIPLQVLSKSYLGEKIVYFEEYCFISQIVTVQ